MTASNRSLQWREKVIEPLFESRTDHMIMYQLAEKLGFGKELCQDTRCEGQGRWTSPSPRTILREINRGTWTIGYTGQSPERLKAHMRNMHVFDVKTLRAKGGKERLRARRRLLRPAVALLRHAGAEAPGLAEPVRHRQARDGRRRQLPRQLRRRARRRQNLLAEDGSPSKGADITTGYPEFDHVLLKKLGWWDELTDARRRRPRPRTGRPTSRAASCAWR